MVGPDRPQMTVRRMRIACWVTKATDTHSEYVILIAFQRQQWLCERASVLRYIIFPVLFILLHASVYYLVFIREAQSLHTEILACFGLDSIQSATYSKRYAKVRLSLRQNTYFAVLLFMSLFLGVTGLVYFFHVFWY